MASDSARARRRQEWKQQHRWDRPKQIARKAVIPTIIVLALAGIVTAIVANNANQPDCPGHWHGTFGVFIDGERVAFPQPPYSHGAEGGKLPPSMHMHTPNQEQLHFEPSTKRCQGIQDTMRLLDVRIKPGELRLEGAHESGPHGGTYEDAGNQTLRVFLQAPEEDLREASIKAILDHQLVDGEKLLIAYGDYDDAEIEAMMETISWPAGFDPAHEATQ